MIPPNRVTATRRPATGWPSFAEKIDRRRAARIRMEPGVGGSRSAAPDAATGAGPAR